ATAINVISSKQGMSPPFQQLYGRINDQQLFQKMELATSIQHNVICRWKAGQIR
ncbi:hypothetical protein ACLOJK_039195, partial [Asimina triloba]